MMHSPSFRSPLFSKKFKTLWKIFPILSFPEKFLDFHPPKFLITFFSRRLKILKSLFHYILHHYYFPLLLKIFPCFREIYVFSYILYVYFVSPYFDYHTMHVLDAPVLQCCPTLLRPRATE